MKSLFAIFISILFIEKTFATKSFPVTTLLNAKWNVTPACLEISEFLSDESPNLYWDYVNEVITLPVPLHELGKFIYSTLKAKTIYFLFLDQIPTQRCTNHQ